MQKNHSSKRIRIALLLLAAASLLFIGWLVYAQKNSSWPFGGDSRTDDEENITTSDAGDSLSDQKKDDMTSGSKSENVDTQKSVTEIPISEELSIRIESLTQQGDGTVSYRAASTGSKSGTCSATFTHKLGKPVIRNSNTSDGTCSATVPAMEFDALGEWTLTLRYYSNNAQAVASQTVMVQ